VRRIRHLAAAAAVALVPVLVVVGCSDDETDLMVPGQSRPRAVITEPVDGDTTLVTVPATRLAGSGTGSSGEDLYPERLHWYLDAIRPASLLGHGEALDRLLPAGWRTIYLVADEAPDRADTASVRVKVEEAANYPPTAAILEPLDGEDFLPAHVTTVLRGAGRDRESGDLTGAELSWRSTADGVLGTGAELVVVLSPGDHQLILTVTDPVDPSLTAADTVTVVVQHRPASPVADGAYYLTAGAFTAIGECAAYTLVVGTGTVSVDDLTGTAALAITDLAGSLACDPAGLCDLAGSFVNGNLRVTAAGTGEGGVLREVEISLYTADPGELAGLLRVIETRPDEDPCVQRSRVVLLAGTD